MEDPTHPGLQEEIEEIQLGVSEHPLQGTDHVHVAEGDLIKEHQRIRRQARPLLKCSKCHKRYRNPTLLLQHVRLHRGSTVYRCGQCEETFKELNKFLDHRATHPPLRKRRKAYDNNGFQFGKAFFEPVLILGPSAGPSRFKAIQSRNPWLNLTGLWDQP